MIVCHFYRLIDGIFDGRSFVTSDPAAIKINTPGGYGARFDIVDWQSQRVVVDTDELVDYQPPQPDDDHEWIHDDPMTGARVRRWALTAEAAERQAKNAAARARMAVLAGKHERASREHLLGIVPTPADRAAGAMTLQEIEDEMAAFRPEVR